MPRTARMSFGVDPSDGPGRGDIFDALDAALDRALHLGLDPVRNRRQIEARIGRLAFISALRRRDGGRLVRGGFGAPANSARGGGVAVHRVQHRLDLVQLAFDRLQPLGHADHLRPARQIHADEIFLHEVAELLLRARRDPADLIDDLGEFRRRHRLIGEGVEPLLHLADHVLPHRDRIVALVCHWRPPA